MIIGLKTEIYYDLLNGQQKVLCPIGCSNKCISETIKSIILEIMIDKTKLLIYNAFRNVLLGEKDDSGS